MCALNMIQHIFLTVEHSQKVLENTALREEIYYIWNDNKIKKWYKRISKEYYGNIKEHY